MIEYAVITRVPELPSGGNMGLNLDLYAQTEVPSRSNRWEGKVEPLDTTALVNLSLLSPVFTVGEVVIVDFDSHEEVVGKRRKLAEWPIGYVTFKDAGEAVVHAKKLLAEKVE